MSLENGRLRLEHLVPTYLEVWEQDKAQPDLYYYEGKTLTHDELKQRASTTPGLTVIRLGPE